MKRMARILCLLLAVLILTGCSDTDPSVAPEPSGAILDTQPVEPVGPVLTEQALAEIAKLDDTKK